MDVQAIQTLISTVGFPIFVAVWMLYKSSKDTEAMKDTLNKNTQAIVQLTAYIKKEDEKDDE